MTKLKLPVLGLALVFAFTVAPSTVFAQEKTKKPKTSKAATQLCQKRETYIKGFSRDMDLWQKHYYQQPTDLSAYPVKSIKGIDGVARETRLASGSVTVYKNGKEAKAKRTNYQLVLDRHNGARSIIEKQAGLTSKASFKDYSSKIAELKSGIKNASEDIQAEQVGWNIKKDNFNCDTKEGQNNAKSLIRERNKIVAKNKSHLKTVSNASHEASKSYKPVAKEYKKTVKTKKR